MTELLRAARLGDLPALLDVQEAGAVLALAQCTGRTTRTSFPPFPVLVGYELDLTG